MTEYIEREAAVKIAAKYGLANGSALGKHSGIADCIATEISVFPAADVAPVRHGKWIEPSRLYYGAKQYECSLCCSDTFWKKHSITEKYPHCPNCGAKMDEGDNNSDMA